MCFGSSEIRSSRVAGRSPPPSLLLATNILRPGAGATLSDAALSEANSPSAAGPGDVEPVESVEADFLVRDLAFLAQSFCSPN